LQPNQQDFHKKSCTATNKHSSQKTALAKRAVCKLIPILKSVRPPSNIS
jgi:hypothetical protein